MLLFALSVLSACFTSSGDDDKDGRDTSLPDTSPEPVCTEPVPPTCADEMVLHLSLHDRVTDGEVTTTVDGEDFVTEVDASAHGYQEAANHPWVYLRFEEGGAVRVDIDDETALEDMTWDLALRRFIIRVNSGDSGPSCVGAASFIGFTYDELTSVPDGVSYVPDDYYTEDCTLINDSSGLPGSPQTAMGAWWEYPGCVVMTATPFLIQRADGTLVKLVVEKYYEDDAGQAECDTEGATRSAGGFIRLRWKWM